MGLLAGSPVLIGRTRELDRLLEAMGVASAQGSAVALVAGEAGVGKTRLVHELSARAVDQGWRVCIGRCVDLGEAIWPLAPLREIVGGLVDDLDEEALDLVIGGARGVLARLVPELGDAASGGDPLTSDRLCESGRGSVLPPGPAGPARVGGGGFALGGRQHAAAVLGVGVGWSAATRASRWNVPERRGGSAASVADRASRDRTRRALRPIDVQPLDRSATAEFVGAIDATAGRQFVDDVRRRSGGNPFFVEELVAAAAPADLSVYPTRCGMSSWPGPARSTTSIWRSSVWLRPPVPLLPTCWLMSPASTRSGAAALERLFNGALLVPDGDEVRFRHELGVRSSRTN